jgi:hypothetical protein
MRFRIMFGFAIRCNSMRCVGAALTLFAAAAPALAQGGLELGVDAGVGLDLEPPVSFDFQFPLSALRVRFSPSSRVSVEPRLGVQFLARDQADPAYAIVTELGLPVRLSASAPLAGPHVRPLVGLSLVNSGVRSDQQFHAGAAVGITLPAGVEWLGIRLESGFRRAFGTETRRAASLLFATVGLSFRTR